MMMLDAGNVGANQPPTTNNCQPPNKNATQQFLCTNDAGIDEKITQRVIVNH